MTDNKSEVDLEKRDVEGLTEVLRLQAEALSRISERMSGINQGARKTPLLAPEKEKTAPGNGVNLPVVAGDPALNEESLPVLNSFKQFLDQERRKGRKRYIWSLVGFTAVFVCVLSIIVKLNFDRVHALRADLQQTSSRLDRSQQEAGEELKKMADTTAQSVEKNTATMRSDITRNILWAHSALSSNMTSALTDRDGEMERLKEKVSTLEVENTMLARQVAELAQRIKIIETDYLDNIERRFSGSRAADVEQIERTVSNMVPVEKTAPLTINSAKFGRSMQMRVPKE